MKKFAIPALAAILALASCTGKTATIEGKVVDVVAGSIVIALPDSEITVNTSMSDPTKVPGVLLGDVVKVCYEPVVTEDGTEINAVRTLDIAAPSYYRVIAGSWITTGINESDRYGFTLAEDGSAVSISNSALPLTDWVLDGEELVLTSNSADSESGKQSVVYSIVKLDADSLVLSNKETGTVEWACGRVE